MSLLDQSLGDLGWTATRDDGLPVLVLEALDHQASRVFNGILIENLMIRSTTPGAFILIEGFGSPNILLETSLPPTQSPRNSVESAVAALLAADWNGNPWKLIVQYRSPDGGERFRAWLTQGKSGIRTRLLPAIGTGDSSGISLSWPVRIFS